MDAGRIGEARRHLKALNAHPDSVRAAPLIAQLRVAVEAAEHQL